MRYGWSCLSGNHRPTASHRFLPLLLADERRWISTEEVANEHYHRGLNALHIMCYPFIGGIVFMLLCRVLYDVLWGRGKIASVRQQARFESAGINMNKRRGKTVRDMA